MNYTKPILDEATRLILANQYEILANQALTAKDKSTAKECHKYREILIFGYESLYHNFMAHLHTPLSESAAQLVSDILSIFRMVSDYRIKNKIGPKKEVFRYDFFPGFDGNSEAKYLFYYHFLIQKEGAFSDAKRSHKLNDSGNSHAEMVGIYEPMIAKWRELGGGYYPDKETISKILDAK